MDTEVKKYIDSKFKKLEKRIKELEKELERYTNPPEINDLNNLLDNDIEGKANVHELDEKQYNNVIFVDGACSKKDKNGIRKAGFGIYINDITNIDYLKNFKLYKRFNNVSFSINNKTLSLTDFNQTMELEVTNIRAEGYAILYVLIIFKLILIDKVKISDTNKLIKTLDNYTIFSNNNFKQEIKLCNNCDSKDILIVTDSEFWINVITKWSPKWFNKDIILEKKNPDLVLYVMYYYHLLLKNKINVDFKHVKGHAEKKKVQYYTYYEAGNIEADKLAVQAKESFDYLFHNE